MRSPINWGVLGLLLERSGYGYDLFHRFERTYAELLELSSPSQIYKALDALEERGLIEPLPSEVAVPEEQRQRKTHYRACAEAVPSYRDWLLAQVSSERQHLELLALAVGALPARDALLVVDRYERYLLAERASAPPPLDGASARARRLAEQAKQLETGVALKWTTYARRELQAAIDAALGGRALNQKLKGASLSARGKLSPAGLQITPEAQLTDPAATLQTGRASRP
jgi:DNA-binding PadR family transcriptional regulator